METFEGTFKSLHGFDIDVGRSDQMPEIVSKKFEIKIRHDDPDVLYALYEKLYELLKNGWALLRHLWN